MSLFDRSGPRPGSPGRRLGDGVFTLGPFSESVFGECMRPRYCGVATRIAIGQQRFAPTKFVIKPPEIQRVHLRDRPGAACAPASGVNACFFQLQEHVSPHMVARQIIDSCEDMDKVGACIMKSRHGSRVLFPNKENVEKLLHDNAMFFELYHVSTDVRVSSFWKLAGLLALSQCGKMPKPICHMHMIDLTTGNPYTPLLIPRLLDKLKTVRDLPMIPILGHAPADPVTPAVPFVQYFAQDVPEFEDRRSPPEHHFDFGKTVPPLDTSLPHHTVSYIKHVSPLQNDVFASFLFNSEYISVQTGSEGGEANDDDDMAFGAEIYQFFQVTSVVPDLQVKMANLKRAYAMLVTRPFSEYNRFPEYLLFTIHMLFEKSSKKILDEMNVNYERMAPAIATAVKNVIEKINAEMPRYLMFLTSRYSFYAARSYYGFQNDKLDQAKRWLNENKGPITLDMTTDMMWAYRFLQSYCGAVHRDLTPAKLFFEVMENLEGELLMHKQFVGALILMSTMVDGFREFDARFAQETRDILTLQARDKFIVKVAERSVLVDGVKSNDFIHSDAPLSMRLFFEYAVGLSTTKNDMSPQKLTFATYSGCKLMSQINTFCGILSSLQVTGEFTALCDAYYDHPPEGEYIYAVAEILQGRRICGISKPGGDKIVIRNVPHGHPYQLSSHYMYICEEPPSPQEAEEEDAD